MKKASIREATKDFKKYEIFCGIRDTFSLSFADVLRIDENGRI